jgi:hypothetical protein
MQKISFILLFDFFLEPIWICLYILKFIYCYRLDLCPYRIFFLKFTFLNFYGWFIFNVIASVKYRWFIINETNGMLFANETL